MSLVGISEDEERSFALYLILMNVKCESSHVARAGVWTDYGDESGKSCVPTLPLQSPLCGAEWLPSLSEPQQLIC